MKNWNIAIKGPKSLWKAEGTTGVTWFAAVFETDRKGLLCFLCLLGLIIFDIEIRKTS